MQYFIWKQRYPLSLVNECPYGSVHGSDTRAPETTDGFPERYFRQLVWYRVMQICLLTFLSCRLYLHPHYCYYNQPQVKPCWTINITTSDTVRAYHQHRIWSANKKPAALLFKLKNKYARLKVNNEFKKKIK